MNFLKVTQMCINTKGIVEEQTTYVNFDHVRQFATVYMDNFKMELTSFEYAIGGYGRIFVKESPEQIINLINNK